MLLTVDPFTIRQPIMVNELITLPIEVMPNCSEAKNVKWEYPRIPRELRWTLFSSCFFPQFFISYFPSPWPVFLLQNSSSWTFWRTPQIALHTIPSSFQKDPIICPALVPLTSLIIGLQTFLQIAQVLLSAKQSWERWVLFVVVQPYCWSRTGIRTFD